MKTAEETIYDEMEESIQEALLRYSTEHCAKPYKKAYVFYSAYESTEDEVPINNLSAIPISGKLRIRMTADKYWGGAKAKDFESPIIDSPTWLELCVQADLMIRKTRDTHHTFLEGIEEVDEEDGVKICEFQMGS